MLTEIEWWGGILIIWSLVCYMLVFKESRHRLTVDYLATTIAFIASTLVLVMYFYSLHDKLLHQVYVGALILGVVSLLLSFVWPGEGDAGSEEARASDGGESNKESLEDEELSLGYEILGQTIFLFPVLVSFALGVYKSVELIGSF